MLEAITSLLFITLLYCLLLAVVSLISTTTKGEHNENNTRI